MCVSQETDKQGLVCVCECVSICVLAVHMRMSVCAFESEESLHVTTCVLNTCAHEDVCLYVCVCVCVSAQLQRWLRSAGLTSKPRGSERSSSALLR